MNNLLIKLIPTEYNQESYQIKKEVSNILEKLDFSEYNITVSYISL